MRRFGKTASNVLILLPLRYLWRNGGRVRLQKESTTYEVLRFELFLQSLEALRNVTLGESLDRIATEVPGGKTSKQTWIKRPDGKR